MKLINRFTTPAYLAIVVAIGAIVRFYHIAGSSIWHDEGYTMMLAPDGPVEIIHRTARDVHPPLYYITLHYWMNLFGSSEIAARGLSAVFMLLVILLAYGLVRKLYTEDAARLAALFVAVAPFLVRYSQEARMYGMVAFLLLLATYALIQALRGGERWWWLVYALSISASLYTHYYSVFMIVVHWAYVATLTNRKKRSGLFNPWWWGSNVLAAGLFLPWVPSVLAQLKRVQSSFWIPKATIATLPNTLLQFLTFNNFDVAPVDLKVALAIVFAGLVIALFISARKYHGANILMASYALAGPILVVSVSAITKRPIYVDRYFVFAAVGFYCLLGIIYVLGWPFRQRPQLQGLAILGTLAVFAFGIGSVYVQGNHQMKKIGAIVNAQATPGDEIVSGELYTFFDYSYYNHTGIQTMLWSKNGVNGYGETSLIYDRADQIVVRNLVDLHPTSGYLWMVGKTGTKDYYTKIPANWTPVGQKYEYGTSAVQRFKITP
jgi:mannosyltransferase